MTNCKETTGRLLGWGFFSLLVGLGVGGGGTSFLDVSFGFIQFLITCTVDSAREIELLSALQIIVI